MSYEKTVSVIEKKVEFTPEDVGYYAPQINVLDGLLNQLMAKKRIQAASYIISKDDKVFVHKSMGKLRYNDENKQLLPDTIRTIASVTKSFTAVAIMQLVERGLIRLDQPVAEILPEFQNPMYEKVTIFHLLTHTSGIRPDPGVLFEPYPREWDWFDSKDWIKGILTDFRAVEIGKEWRYCSSGFAILAEIVSRKSGVHYENYVMDNIVKPLGMNDTFFDVPLELADRLCFINEWEEKHFYDRSERPEWAAPRGGGGLYSTLEDMRKFGQMLVNKGTLASKDASPSGARILSRKAVETMTRNHTQGVKIYCYGLPGYEVDYGLGVGVHGCNVLVFPGLQSPGSFSHEGAGLCGLFMDPIENLVLAYMCPLGPGVGWDGEAVMNLRNIVWAGIL